MNRRILLGYQLLTGFTDTTTGILLIVAPGFTVSLMRLHTASDALPFLSFIGAFVFSVGLACTYGALLIWHRACRERIEMVWLLTAIMRSSVAIFVTQQVMSGRLEPGWLGVAVTDGAFAIFQAVGMRKGWSVHVPH